MGFPEELKKMKQWVCWRLTPDKDGGKPRKLPINPVTRKAAASNKPETWSDYVTAVDAKDRYGYTGIGFMFTKEAGVVGVDIDHCYDAQTEKFNEIAAAILAKQPTYAEFSPSGDGCHLWFKGKKPAGSSKNSATGVEMYDSVRYFTVTEKQITGSPDTLTDSTAALAWIHETYIKPPKKEKSKGSKRKSKGKGKPLTDEEVLENAASAENGEVFTALWDGSWQDYYPSQSEADIAVCCKLAFWTGKNREQMDRLFRQSKLFRDKWDVKHHASGATYGEETLNKAIEMIVSDNETQITADLVTVKNEVFRLTFMTTDFSNLQKFKNILNQRTISLSYTGSEGDLELLKNYISELNWVRKIGVKALGMYFISGRWLYVDSSGAVEAGGNVVEDVVQLEKYRSITSNILSSDPISAEKLRELGPLLLGYNEAPKTAAVLAWCAGCFLKNHLKRVQIKYPHLFLIGEAGSGKSNTLERVILPIFGRTKVAAAAQVTAFTLMKDSASSNIVPQPLDEFKPSKIDKNKLSVLYNHMRDAYDGHEGTRGRADQTTVYYELSAPLIVAGEESPDEAAIRERSIELLFSRKDLKSGESRKSFLRLCRMTDALGDLGRSLMDAALRVNVAEAEKWYTDALNFFDQELPSRILNNLGCCAVGLRLLEQVCKMKSLSWPQAFDIPIEACYRHLAYGAREYLLDGNTVNKGIVEQSIEIMARMGMDSHTQWTFLENGTQVAIRFNKIYDNFTKYRRDYAITGECLPYTQFLKQLRNSDLFVTYKQVRFPDISAKAYVLDFGLLQQRSDIVNFDGTDIEPLA